MMLRNCTLVVFGRRIHHWPVGVGLAALGIALWWDDRGDFLDWVAR
jgi:hypothetical protein